MFRFLRIHTVPKEEEGSTWLQLFFDLLDRRILRTYNEGGAADTALFRLCDRKGLYIEPSPCKQTSYSHEDSWLIPNRNAQHMSVSHQDLTPSASSGS